MLKIFWMFCILVTIKCQREPSIPLYPDTFRPILRAFINVPKGRSTSLSDIRIVYYRDSILNSTSYCVRRVESLLKDENFDLKKPTTLYIYGYVEYANDYSVESVVNAYIQHGGYNILVLDWSNLGFGNYFNVVLDVQAVGKESGKALLKLIKGGFDINTLHIVTHSTGSHIGAVMGRYLMAKGYTVPRLTGLDPAYPGFYPPLLSRPISSKDAKFVDIIHTSAGTFGTPTSTGHVDFWPNEGTPKQPGCLALTIPLSSEDFCGHWRSWRYWVETVVGGNFVARKCANYDSFLRGNCTKTGRMGLQATSDLRGNYYLRTAAQEPFALGDRGAV